MAVMVFAVQTNLPLELMLKSVALGYIQYIYVCMYVCKCWSGKDVIYCIHLFH